jgi:hypothetical protein
VSEDRRADYGIGEQQREAAHGCPEVRFVGSRVLSLACILLTMGALHPHITLARRSASP